MTNLIPAFVTTPEIYTDYKNAYLVLDFETTRDDYNPTATSDKTDIVLACWNIYYRDGRVVRNHFFGTALEQTQLLEDCLKVDFIVAHNSKFEAGYLKKCGLDLKKVLIYCTMLGEWVRYGNLKVDKSLNATAKRYGKGSKLDLVGSMIKKGICVSAMPASWVLNYCYKDVELCREVFEDQVQYLKNRNQLHIVHTRNLTAQVLADIEFNGMSLDSDKVLAAYKESLRRRNWLKRELALLTNNINLGSSKQLAEFLYEKLKFEELSDKRGFIRTPGGAPKADTSTIVKLEATTEEQKNFVKLYAEFNKLDALLTKNLEYFRKVVLEKKGKFTANFRQGVTATHRLSCGGIPTLFIGEKKPRSVQFQNLPRIYKSLFWAGDDEWLIGEADGAQLEFRVGADVGHDKVALKEIIEDADIHSVTAATLTAAGEPTTRQQAKASTFAPLFGGMGKTPAQKAYAKFFKEKYGGITDTQNTWCYTVAAHKQLTLPWGMAFFFPEAEMNKFGRLNVLTNVSNYPIQSLATAEIIPIALIYFWYRIEGTSITILNTIHDSIVTLFKKQDKEVFEAIAKTALTHDVFKHLSQVYKYDFKVPLGVGIKTARNWGDSKLEIIYSVTADGKEKKTIKE